MYPREASLDLCLQVHSPAPLTVAQVDALKRGAQLTVHGDACRACLVRYIVQVQGGDGDDGDGAADLRHGTAQVSDVHQLD